MAKPRKASPSSFQIVCLAIPAKRAVRRLLPFTEAAIALPADPSNALVFQRNGIDVSRAAGIVGSAIRAAKRRDPSKHFEMRKIIFAGSETYALWRIK